MAVYSHSQLQQFVRCELCYAYRYVLKYDEPKTTSMALVLGSAVHDTLERLHKKVSHKTLPTHTDALAQYEQYWTAEMERVDEGIDPEVVTEHHQRGVSYLDRYYEEYHPFDQQIPMQMEKNIHFDLVGGHRMRGKIDRLDIDGHDLTIVDYKTSRSRSSDREDGIRKQITIYAKWLQEEYGTKVSTIRGKIIYLHLQNEVEREITQEEIDAVEAEYVAIIEQIEAKKAKWADVQWLFADGTKVWDIFESRPWPLCSYKELHPELSHAFAVPEEVDAGELGKATIQAMVQQYATLHAEHKLLEWRLKWLKDFLVEYAVSHDHRRLYADDVSVGVQSRAFWSIPSDVSDRAEQYLRERGLRDGLQSIDKHALARLAKEWELDEMVDQWLLVAKKSAWLSGVKKE